MEQLHSKSIAELAHLSIATIPYCETYILKTQTKLDVDEAIDYLFSANQKESNHARRLLEDTLCEIANSIEYNNQNKQEFY